MSKLQRNKFENLLKNFESEELEERIEFEKAWYCSIEVCGDDPGGNRQCKSVCD